MPDQSYEYYYPPEVPAKPTQQHSNPITPNGNNQSGRESQEQPIKLPMSPGKRILIISCVLLMAVSFAFIVRSLVFTLRNIQIIGINDISWQQVAVSAGLTPSSNYFSISEEKIKEGINNNRYLIYDRMQKVFPNTLILYVKERMQVASINYIGISYVMADDGIILSRSRELDQKSMMSVSGLALRDIREGKVPLSSKIGQIETCINLVNELQTQGFGTEILDVNLSEPTRIYLTTRDGFSVHLGDGYYLRAKIRTIRAVISELRKRDLKGGVIEATVPGEATYRPDIV